MATDTRGHLSDKLDKMTIPLKTGGSGVSADIVLDLRGLSKTYLTFKKAAGVMGSLKALVSREHVAVHAVRDVTFSIKRGEFVGLLGPNGAGKTTTLKMLTGLISPTAGQATAFGQYDTARRPAPYLRRIGMVMGQRNQLNPDLPAMDSFKLAQAIYGLPELRFVTRLKQTVDLFGIGDKLLTPVRKLSLGERMKMELILAILHEPELLFLDEPTIGLDFNAARQIREFLREANAKLGITVVLTSHYTKDIEELCRRVVLINHGSIVYDGRLSDVDPRIQGQKTITISFSDAPARTKAAAALAALGLVPATDGANVETPQLAFDVPTRDAAKAVHQVVGAVAPIGLDHVVDLKVTERQIDEIFSEIYQKPREPRA
jgi:ABC-2 type transport system ATP-binding protein